VWSCSRRATCTKCCSATVEDLPGASFAGQLETYLNIRGVEAVLAAVKLCWASLWTARAITYCVLQGMDPGSVALGVVVQKMVCADAAGIIFTANPVTGKRNELVINAAWTPLFRLASAVVTDIGGPLSHGSIVAREYGIPAVVATGDATRRICTGQVITVNGSPGTVILR
jgi:phosphoenolpyruvate synthase/pyruvate phosphate dikinase